MKPPTNFTRIVDRKRYSTKSATLLAGDDYWDGHNFERRGRNTWLYRAPNGGYFRVTFSQWENEQHSLEPLTLDEAISLYESLTEHRVDYAEAFPDVKVDDA